jgi:hypothetical protein
MAQPIMFSATTTGPETENTEPCSSFLSAMVEEACGGGVEDEVEVEEGESGSGGSSAGGDGGVNVFSLSIRSRNDDRALSRGRPNPSIRFEVFMG